MPTNVAVISSQALPLDAPLKLNVERRRRSAFYYNWGGSLESALSYARQRFDQGGNIAVMLQGFSAKAFFFDMDATLIAQESLVEVARLCGKQSEVDLITEKAMRGELDFQTSLRMRLQLLRHLPETLFDDVLKVLTLNPGIAEFSEFCHQRSIPCFLISGGFMRLAKPFVNRLKFVDYFANELIVSNGRLTGEVRGAIVDAPAKAAWVRTKLLEYSINPKDAVAVGDGANDLLMMQEVGYAVGYRAKAILHPHLHCFIGDGDHAFLADVFFEL